jgi:hypothetical protein
LGGRHVRVPVRMFGFPMNGAETRATHRIRVRAIRDAIGDISRIAKYDALIAAKMRDALVVQVLGAIADSCEAPAEMARALLRAFRTTR